MYQDIKDLQEENESLRIQIKWLERSLEETTAAMNAYKNFSKKRFNQEEVDYVEKSIPKKCNYKPYFYGDIYYCPQCNKNLGFTPNEFRYCPDCGQALDWSNYEIE